MLPLFLFPWPLGRYMGHLCKHTDVQGKRLTNNQGIGHLGYLLTELSTQGAPIALKTKAILTGPSYSFPSDDLGTNLPIMFKNHQSPDKLTNPLATTHGSVYSRKTQVISCIMSSGQADEVPKVLSTGRLPSDLQRHPIQILS